MSAGQRSGTGSWNALLRRTTGAAVGFSFVKNPRQTRRVHPQATLRPGLAAPPAFFLRQALAFRLRKIPELFLAHRAIHAFRRAFERGFTSFSAFGGQSRPRSHLLFFRFCRHALPTDEKGYYATGVFPAELLVSRFPNLTFIARRSWSPRFGADLRSGTISSSPDGGAVCGRRGYRFDAGGRVSHRQKV
jgi:hypothetical protein